MKRTELIDLKKKPTDDKINHLIDVTYDIQKSQDAFFKLHESHTNEIRANFQEIDDVIFGSHAEPQAGISPRLIAVEKSRAFWGKLMWIALGSGTGILVGYLIKALFLSSPAG